MATTPEQRPTADPADPKLAFEREKWEAERALRERELRLREADRPSPWRSPLTIAVVAAAMAAAGNAIVSRLNGSAQLEVQKAQGQAQVNLERIKAEQSLIIEAIKTGGDVDKAAANLQFLVRTGLLTDPARAKQIGDYLAVNRLNPERLPSLPSVGQTQPPTRRSTSTVTPTPTPTPTPTLSPRADPALKASTRVRLLPTTPRCIVGNSYCIANDVLIAPGGKPVAIADAIYHGARMRDPKLIVMHFTASADRAAVGLMSAADTPVRASSHIVIERDGTITQLVPFDVISHHVGLGSWNGLTALNGQSIGIEFSNWGRLEGEPGAWQGYSGIAIPDERVFTTGPDSEGRIEGWEKFTDAQLAAADRIVAALARSYPTLRWVIGHSDVMPRRRIDPGAAFPLARYQALLEK